MLTSDLERYCERALLGGAIRTRIHPGMVVTAPWVRFKCLYGCFYKHRYRCPPYTPTSEETQTELNSYNRAILIHIDAADSEERYKEVLDCFSMLVKVEGELFLKKATIRRLSCCPVPVFCASNVEW